MHLVTSSIRPRVGWIYRLTYHGHHRHVNWHELYTYVFSKVDMQTTRMKQMSTGVNFTPSAQLTFLQNVFQAVASRVECANNQRSKALWSEHNYTVFHNSLFFFLTFDRHEMFLTSDLLFRNYYPRHQYKLLTGGRLEPQLKL